MKENDLAKTEIGININCKHQDFIQQILDGQKTVETRNSPSLRCYVGRRVGLIKTGCGKAKLCGFATITREIHYRNEKEFRQDEERHLVAKGSIYDIDAEKYGYVLKDVVSIEPIEIRTKGIVARKLRGN